MTTSTTPSPWYARISGAYILMIFCVPLVPPVGGYTIGLSTKELWLFLLTAIYLLLFLLVPIGLKLLKKPIQRPTFSWDSTTALLLCYLLCCLISALCSEYTEISFLGQGTAEGLLSLVRYAFIFLVAKNWVVPSRRIFIPVFLFAGVNFILILFQFLGYNPLNFYELGMNFFDGYDGYHGLFLGTTGSVTFTALCFAWLALSALFWMIYHKKSPLAFFIFAGSLCVLLLCDVDGGYLGFLVGACTLILAKLLHTESRTQSLMKLILVLVGLGVGCIALVYLLPWNAGVLGEVHLLLHGEASETFGSSRIGIWQESLSIFQDHPLWGTGSGTYRQYSTILYSRYIEEYNWLKLAHVETAHNDFLNILVCTGLFSLCAYVLFLGSVIQNLGRNVYGARRVLLFTLILAFCTHIFFAFSTISVTPIFWIFLAFASQKAPNKNEIGT